ncbi:7-carboxy-7-deazaguanine synthase QueE [Verrucomicrobiota bacterium]
MTTVNICETFESIQGESSYAGLSCFFIRFAGCNLRCSYCDTTYAYEPGADMAIAELVDKAMSSSAVVIEITGGEPLLQPGFSELAAELRNNAEKPVLVETNGSRDISIVPDNVITIMDIKCPGSGESSAMDLNNIERLKLSDEVKFVIGDKGDYKWASDFVKQYDLTSVCNAVFLNPVFGMLEAKELGEWILEDGLSVRLGVQLHKIAEIK